MISEIDNILEMLKQQLEELIENIHLLETTQTDRNVNGEITNYVYRENTGLLKKELASMQWLISNMSAQNFKDITSISEAKNVINILLEKHKLEADMPEAVISIVSAKLDKIVENNEI